MIKYLTDLTAKYFFRIIATASVVLIVSLYFFDFQGFASTLINKTITTNLTLEDGLVGHWTFDGDLETTITDRSGNGNNGSISGSPTSTMQAIGKIGQALEFDGSDDRITATIPSTYWNRDNNLPFTMSAWIHPLEDSYGARAFALSVNHANQSAGIFASSSSFGIGSQDNGGNFDRVEYTPTTFHTWHHVVLRGTSASSLTMYIDGVLRGSVSISPIAGFTSGTTFYIGSGVSTEYLHAILDDIRIYDRALSAKEIQSLYQLGGTTHINKTITTNDDLERGLVGHYTFDGAYVDWDNTSAEIRDSGIYDSHHGNAIGMSDGSVVPGKIGQALYLDGSDEVNIGSPSYYDNLNYYYTLSAWVKTNVAQAHCCTRMVASYRSSYESTGLQFNSNNKIQFWSRDASGNSLGPSSISTLNDGSWHHAVGVRNNDTFSLYIDGVFNGTSTNATVGDTTNATQSWFIGSSNNDAFFNGNLDDVRIYNRALSVNEVTRLYDLGATTHVNKTITTNPDLENGLVGHWTFDGNIDTTITDSSGQGNNGSISGSATATMQAIGKIGQALEFDGSDDEIVIGDVLDQTGSFSISTWVYPHDVAGTVATDDDIRIIVKDDETSGWFLSIGDANTTGRVRFGIRQTSPITTDTGNALAENAWQHVVAVWNTATDVRTVYIDGEVAAQSTGVTGDSIGTSARLTIGGNASGINNRNFNGRMDDMRLYNRALSATEVQKLYELGK